MAQLTAEELAAIRDQVSKKVAASADPVTELVVTPIALIQDDRSAERIRPDALRLSEHWVKRATTSIRRASSLTIDLASTRLDVIEGSSLRPTFASSWTRFLEDSTRKRPVLLTVEGPFVEAVTARLLGATDEKPGRPRAPSEVGRALFARIGQLIAASFRAVALETADIELVEVEGREPADDLRRYFLEQDSLIAVTIETTEPAEGRWRLITRPETLSSRPHGSGHIARPSRRLLEELLEPVRVEVSVELGRARLAIRELKDLVPGALFELDTSVESPLPIRCGNVIKAYGKPVLVSGAVSVEICNLMPAQGETQHENVES